MEEGDKEECCELESQLGPSEETKERTRTHERQQRTPHAPRYLGNTHQPLSLDAHRTNPDRDPHHRRPNSHSRHQVPPIPPLLLPPPPRPRSIPPVDPLPLPTPPPHLQPLPQPPISRFQARLQLRKDRRKDEEANNEEPPISPYEDRGGKEVPFASSAVDTEVAYESPSHLDDRGASDSEGSGKGPLVSSTFWSSVLGRRRTTGYATDGGSSNGSRGGRRWSSEGMEVLERVLVRREGEDEDRDAAPYREAHDFSRGGGSRGRGGGGKGVEGLESDAEDEEGDGPEEEGEVGRGSGERGGGGRGGSTRAEEGEDDRR